MSSWVKVRAISRSQNIRLGGQKLTRVNEIWVDLDDPKIRRDLERHSAIGAIIKVAGTQASVGTYVQNAQLGGCKVTALGTAEVQTVGLGAASAGTVTIQVPAVGALAGGTTSGIAFGATVATIQSAMNTAIGAGNVVVSGANFPGVAIFTFTGAYAGVDIPTMVVTPTGLTGGTVTVTTVTNGSSVGGSGMVLAVAPGTLVKDGGATQAVAGNNVSVATADATNPRIDNVVVTDSSGVASIVSGTPAAVPVRPAIAGGTTLLAEVSVPANDTAISQSQITDRRASVATTHTPYVP